MQWICTVLQVEMWVSIFVSLFFSHTLSYFNFLFPPFHCFPLRSCPQHWWQHQVWAAIPQMLCWVGRTLWEEDPILLSTNAVPHAISSAFKNWSHRMCLLGIIAHNTRIWQKSVLKILWEAYLWSSPLPLCARVVRTLSYTQD